MDAAEVQNSHIFYRLYPTLLVFLSGIPDRMILRPESASSCTKVRGQVGEDRRACPARGELVPWNLSLAAFKTRSLLLKAYIYFKLPIAHVHFRNDIMQFTHTHTHTHTHVHTHTLYFSINNSKTR